MRRPTFFVRRFLAQRAGAPTSVTPTDSRPAGPLTRKVESQIGSEVQRAYALDLAFSQGETPMIRMIIFGLILVAILLVLLGVFIARRMKKTKKVLEAKKNYAKNAVRDFDALYDHHMQKVNDPVTVACLQAFGEIVERYHVDMALSRTMANSFRIAQGTLLKLRELASQPGIELGLDSQGIQFLQGTRSILDAYTHNSPRKEAQ